MTRASFLLGGVASRGVVRLSTSGMSGGQERNISSVFLVFLLFPPIFPQFLFIFFLNLNFRVGGSPTRECPGYATGGQALYSYSQMGKMTLNS